MGAVGAVKPSAVKRGDLRNLWTLLVDSVRLVAGKTSLSIFSTPALFSFYHTLSAAAAPITKPRRGSAVELRQGFEPFPLSAAFVLRGVARSRPDPRGLPGIGKKERVLPISCPTSRKISGIALRTVRCSYTLGGFGCFSWHFL